MRQLLLFAVLLFGIAGVCQAASWQHPPNSQYNGDPDWTFKINIYYQIGGNEPVPAGTFSYNGPTAVYVDYGMGPTQVGYRWDLRQQIVHISGGIGENVVFGVVRNQYVGSQIWYDVDTLIYTQQP